MMRASSPAFSSRMLKSSIRRRSKKILPWAESRRGGTSGGADSSWQTLQHRNPSMAEGGQLSDPHLPLLEMDLHTLVHMAHAGFVCGDGLDVDGQIRRDLARQLCLL